MQPFSSSASSFFETPKIPVELAESLLNFIDNKFYKVSHPQDEEEKQLESSATSPIRRSTRLCKQPRIRKIKSVTTKPLITSETTQEVYLNYNSSNTPKYVGKFRNELIGGHLKRKCMACSANYSDLKGFNRHYERKHLG
ncbi:hypothetical protein G210_5885 [Candida maltosa Xu316]|uniref:C2H2-type domain-containing protein n=1 Tax=Candida maltosa (strain Xu316) TaxID=1245528 RepID=M3K253_CANMX|nr:hypothetical protein G210_5885 [Candida maltosa Xu316]